ncbi:hypothetical protein [Streptomyces sp. NPDC093094]|uniref:hypothetical protein n=1 Tax=Streptomyces sp. NPDC093094 TaxID=3366026 RepID=UPI0037F30E2E
MQGGEPVLLRSGVLALVEVQPSRALPGGGRDLEQAALGGLVVGGMDDELDRGAQ